jgi:subtilisin family serine protease
MSPALMVELTDQASKTFRDGNEVPSFLVQAGHAQVKLTAVFYEPKDPIHAAIYYELGMSRWFRLEDKIMAAADLAISLKPGGELLRTELIYPVTGGSTPNDFSIHNMWGLTRMQCPAAWDIATGSSQILVTTIDTGCRIQHPDLAANIYVNPGEDVNGNGIWDAADNNGIDDDGNGFVDDLVGWDFVSHNPSGSQSAADGEEYSPRDNLVYPDIHGHGTHVAGTLAGVTNNSIGVASASWNVKQMPLRAGYACIIGGNLASRGYWDDFSAAIQYAVDMGVRIISISFYGSSGWSGLQSAIQYARANDCLVFCCAGNDNSSALRYPAAYPEAIAVANTDATDHRYSSSSYGTWIDLCAPGVGIWSTMCNSTYNPADYASWTGTSMSTPNAAAVAALMMSFNPTLTDDQTEGYLRASCDSIDALNPSYARQLGSGRVNAYRALLLASPISVPTGLVVTLADPSHLCLSWNHSANPFYRVYADSSALGEFATLVATSTDTTVVLDGAELQHDLRFFQVHGSSQP